MAQQSAMHSPYTPAHGTTTSTDEARTITRRRTSYHSLELDQRLVGNTTAAVLHELEDAANRMDLNRRTSGADNKDTLNMREVDVPVPVPVLDAVLLWSSDSATATTTTTTTTTSGPSTMDTRSSNNTVKYRR